MKTKLVVFSLLFALFVGAAIAQTMIGVGQWVRVNTATDPPVALTNAATKARRVTFVGRKDNRTDNTGTVWVGMITNNGAQPIKIATGETVSLLIPENTQIDLSKIYLDVETANDGVLILWE